MPLSFAPDGSARWSLRKIAVIGPGIVGTPMAALLAHARITEGARAPAHVVVVQRASITSGWKVDAINAGCSPIGGIEPELDAIIRASVQAGLLSATHDYGTLRDADVVLVCVQTDKKGWGPDYGPLLDALNATARELARREPGQLPLVIIESTLAPSSMATIVRDLFAEHGLEDGVDVLLANSPNRVMPGRLVERVADSDKLVAGTDPRTTALVARLYRHVVRRGTLHQTSSLTAEIVKTLENAYRDVRIAFAAELVRWCDDRDVDFYSLRDAVNARLEQADAASWDGGAIPSGALLVPMIGVGGHCLPKDGALLWWRRREAGHDPRSSLILQARRINDGAPQVAIDMIERQFGPVRGRHVALLGVAYRFDSEDTRNSPTLALARRLEARGAVVTLHDPHVHERDQNLVRSGMAEAFSRELAPAVSEAQILVFCSAHAGYRESLADILAEAPSAEAVFDGANVFRRADVEPLGVSYSGIGRGWRAPGPELISFALDAFRAMERGLANELLATLRFLNERYAANDFNRATLEDVRRLAGTCVTGCAIAEPGPVYHIAAHDGWVPSLVRIAVRAGRRRRLSDRIGGVPELLGRWLREDSAETAAG